MEPIIFELIIFVSFLLLSGFLTASEIAVSSYGEKKIEELKEKKDELTFAFESIIKNPEPFFGSISILTSVLIISSAILGFHIILRFLASLSERKFELAYSDPLHGIISSISAVLILTVLMIIFGYLIPKAIGSRYSNGLGRFAVKFLLPASKLFIIPVKSLTVISNFLLMPFKEKTNFSQTRPSEDEILGIIDDGVKSGTIDEKEQEIIENIFEFNDLKANEVMIPRTEMTAVDIQDEKEYILNIIVSTGHTLIPVFRDSPDNIVGVLHSKDIIRTLIEKTDFSVERLIRPAYFIPETKLISEVLTEMQQQGERIAIVTDEYGGTEGVISMEGILEEIVGEIKDKTKTESKNYAKLPDGKYYILGSMLIEDFNNTFTLHLPESHEYSTVAGFIADRTGKILIPGEHFEFVGIKFELIKKTRQKMVQFKVYSDQKVFVEKRKE